MHTVPSGLGLCEEHHGKDHRQSQRGPALCAVPGWSKNLQCHYHRDVAGLLGKKKLWSKRTSYRFLPELDANMNVTSQLCTMYPVTVRHDGGAKHQPRLPLPESPCLSWCQHISKYKYIDVRERLEGKHVNTFFPIVRHTIEIQSPGTCPRI